MVQHSGQSASREHGIDTCDFVIIGGGPNGLGIAAYLSAAGYSVVVLEARPEIGGGAENCEPEPGISIDPHATFLYGAAAPIFDQLQLYKYGLRLAPNLNKAGGITPDGKSFAGGLYNPKSMDVEYLSRSLEPMAALGFSLVNQQVVQHATSLLRSIYWTPPYDEAWGVAPQDLPWVKYMRDEMPVFNPAWIDMSVEEFCDDLGLTDPVRGMLMFGAWYNGPAPSWKGMAIPGFACNLLMLQSAGAPVGGMHGLAHAVIRCAIAHGAKIFANAPVGEILMDGRRAKGVILDDSATTPGREFHARIAVISAIHVRQTLAEMVPQSALDRSFRKRVNDIDVKGGSLFVGHLLLDELPQYPGFSDLSPEEYPACTVLNCTGEALLAEMRDVYGLRTHSTDLANYVIPYCVNEIFDPARQNHEGVLISPIYLQCPPPEDHRDGPEAVNKAAEQIMDNFVTLLCDYSSNITPEKVRKRWWNTPHDSEIRNMAFVGGNWLGARECRDQWWDKRPLPELARYRTPVENLYLCNHTSYPGGLCLFAVPYNLMHILIEDYELSMPDWWYPSPWHISDKEGGTQ